MKKLKIEILNQPKLKKNSFPRKKSFSQSSKNLVKITLKDKDLLLLKNNELLYLIKKHTDTLIGKKTVFKTLSNLK